MGELPTEGGQSHQTDQNIVKTREQSPVRGRQPPTAYCAKLNLQEAKTALTSSLERKMTARLRAVQLKSDPDSILRVGTTPTTLMALTTNKKKHEIQKKTRKQQENKKPKKRKQKKRKPLERKRENKRNNKENTTKQKTYKKRNIKKSRRKKKITK